ncbi:universal stress protein [Sphingomicrobium aestuariivivum]|uniref:universal stress protein n=1 Tax=Sphingomicrobium aestuariivivum TaxID=1582356 RepID=UPI001FD6950D|nr:universal stress protein [Sphingomicrobium aestuariivivum]MCJ8191177.1 universal stress protein [Sphingomicrobium aestuariivivum]
MYTILVHVVGDRLLTLRLETALAAARAIDGHLRCLHASPTHAFGVVDSFGAVHVTPSILATLADAERATREAVEAELGNEDVSWEYLHLEATRVRSLAAHATLADFLVVARDPVGKAGENRSIGTVAHLLMHSSAPMLVPCEAGPRFDPFEPVVIGWNGSREAANAVRGALPLLRLSARVVVVSGRSATDREEADFPATDLLEYLSRHGITADYREQRVHNEAVPDLLRDQVANVGARLLVIGGYGHRRLSEYMFGGVTRSLLRSSPVALLVAH